MKGREIKAEDIKQWKERGYFPVVCRICDEVMLYPRKIYNPKDFIGWECGCARKSVYERMTMIPATESKVSSSFE